MVVFWEKTLSIVKKLAVIALSILAASSWGAQQCFPTAGTYGAVTVTLSAGCVAGTFNSKTGTFQGTTLCTYTFSPAIVTNTATVDIDATNSNEALTISTNAGVYAASNSDLTGPFGTGGSICTLTTAGGNVISACNYGSAQFRFGAAAPASITSFSMINSVGVSAIQVCADNGVAPPSVTSTNPTSGPTSGGTSVTLTGTGFVNGATVTIGGVPATGVTWNSATSITLTTPAGTAGAKNVVVTNPDTQSGTMTNGFTYAAAPTVTSINPTSGTTLGGTSVTLTGSNFIIGATTVTIGGASCTVPTVSTTTSMTCTSPAGAAGASSVLATTSGGTNAANALYTYVVPVRTYPAASATGSGTITASFTGGGAGCGFAVSRYIPVSGAAGSPPAGTAPAGVSFPHGLFDFTTNSCTVGSTLNFTVIYPQALPAGTVYWKYGPTPSDPSYHWYQLPAVIAGNTATFSITDGGLGDDDLIANGAVIDQGGPGFPIVAVEIPTLSEWAQILSAGLLMLMGMKMLRRRRL